ncbi:MAG: hypothetical protein RL338_1069 [Chloroflexota bacterium]|jgi:hypothetical protein
MRNKAAALLSLFAVLAIGVSPVLAGNPHLVRVGGSLDEGTRRLSVTYKIAGLGNGQYDTFSLDADYYIDFFCVHKNGSRQADNNGKPFRSPRTGTIAEQVSVADKYGMVNGRLSVRLAPPICTAGQAWSPEITDIHFNWARGRHSAGADVMDLIWE